MEDIHSIDNKLALSYYIHIRIMLNEETIHTQVVINRSFLQLDVANCSTISSSSIIHFSREIHREQGN